MHASCTVRAFEQASQQVFHLLRGVRASARTPSDPIRARSASKPAPRRQHSDPRHLQLPHLYADTGRHRQLPPLRQDVKKQLLATSF